MRDSNSAVIRSSQNYRVFRDYGKIVDKFVATGEQSSSVDALNEGADFGQAVKDWLEAILATGQLRTSPLGGVHTYNSIESFMLSRGNFLLDNSMGIWITGLMGSGKTAIAQRVKRWRSCIPGTYTRVLSMDQYYLDGSPTELSSNEIVGIRNHDLIEGLADDFHMDWWFENYRPNEIVIVVPSIKLLNEASRRRYELTMQHGLVSDYSEVVQALKRQAEWHPADAAHELLWLLGCIMLYSVHYDVNVSIVMNRVRSTGYLRGWHSQ